VLLVTCLLGGGLFVLWATTPENRVTEANFAKIEQGMSRDAVRKILGPEGDYTGGRGRAVSGKGNVFGLLKDPRPDTWMGQEMEIRVWFDTDGTVAHKDNSPVLYFDETFIERLRRWLGL
jgi:hypothetical protein